ncbi:autotransporter outer membrane beta-barrel domain-containing protein [Oryzicola mucosus]|uniref:Autotransporter domain-containing protein n=1 Tax=Oryzicola mucosus TaxID=2767425 RepID=A0A8J6PLB6_9HYPH|nr:autotransporter domain-containing protein [Oryzicola mucosus]MBD0416583.1 autotransporter domain-containing protein [Oryzicola mucosus]
MLHLLSTVAMVSVGVSGAVLVFPRDIMAQEAAAPVALPFQITREDVQAVDAAVAAKRALVYSGTESAGDAAITNNDGDTVQFLDSSTGANATIVNNTGGATSFEDASTAGSALITNNSAGSLTFSDNATAANANITNNEGGAIGFDGNATGGQANVTNNGSIAFEGNSRGDRINVVNNEGADITFNDRSNAGAGQYTNNGQIVFNDSSDAGTISLTNNKGAAVDFNGASSAGQAAIANSGAVRFNDDSTADEAAIVNNKSGSVTFDDKSSAGSAFVSNSGALAFKGNSSAADADIVNNATGTIAVSENASLGNATVNNGGQLELSGNATAGSSSILTGPNGTTIFSERSSGGTAALETDAGGVVDFSGVTAGLITVGSIQGPGDYRLGGVSLQVGGNNLSTTVDGVISDGGLAGGSGGSLVKVGTGTLTLGGENSYTGVTLIRNGVLQAGAENSFSEASAVEMSAQARLDLAGFDQTIASLAGAGAVDLTTATLTLGGNDTDTAFSGAIEGLGGLVKTGAGSFELSGISTYSGATAVKGGRLIVSGSISESAVSVDADAILAGTGTVGATTVGGTLERKNDGTLTVDGDLTFAQGSTYHVTLTPDESDPLLVVNGTAALDGASLLVSPTGGFTLDGTRFTVLTAAAITGEFDEFDADRPFVDLALFYGPTSVDLTVIRNSTSFDDVARTANQKAAADGLESVGDGDLYTTVALIGDEAAARAAFDTLSGEIHPSLANRLAMESSVSRTIVLDQAALSLAESRAAKGSRVWIAPHGSLSETESDGNAAGYDWQSAGFLAGGDVEVVPGWVIGAAGGYGTAKLTLDARSSQANVDTLTVAAYSAASVSGFRLKVGGAYSWHDIDTDRTVVIDTFADRPHASYRARTGQAFADVSYPISWGAARVEPFGNIAYVSVTTDGFAETGGEAALTTAKSTVDGIVTTLGVRGGTQVELGSGAVADFGISAGWRHAALDRFGGEARFAGGDLFFVGGVPVDPNSLVLGASAKISKGPAVFALSYNAEIGELSQLHTVRGQVQLRF